VRNGHGVTTNSPTVTIRRSLVNTFLVVGLDEVNSGGTGSAGQDPAVVPAWVVKAPSAGGVGSAGVWGPAVPG
jgi:hypothetical protein